MPSLPPNRILPAPRFQLRIETDQYGFGAAPSGFPQRAPDKRRPAAGRDPDDDVLPTHATELDRPSAGPRVVLRAFHRLPQCALPAGNDALDQFGWRAKRRRTFTGIEHPQPSAGASPNVEQSPASLETAHDELHCSFDLLSFRQNRPGNFFVFAEHQPDGFHEGDSVQIQRARVSLFGWTESPSWK